jgi:DNA-binding response OmpR family regulator
LLLIPLQLHQPSANPFRELLMSALTTHPKGRILVIEDESKLAHFVEAELTYQGYQVLVASDEQTGLAMAQNTAQLPDLALVDWMLPSGSGLEICRRLRALGLRIPVIMMTPKDGVPDRVASLDAGADDYVLKPFSIQDLLSRMQAHLQRPSPPPDSLQLIFLDLALDPLNRTATRGSRLIELTAKEFDLLRYLMEHPRQVLSRQQILENVWGYEFMGDSNIIEVYIRYLRLKVEQEGEKRLIQTVRGVGYVLRD